MKKNAIRNHPQCTLENVTHFYKGKTFNILNMAD